MNSTKHSIAVALFASMRNGNEHYTKASEHRLRELLTEYHGIEIKRRWLFKCLADMEEDGLITRRRRYRNEERGKIRQYSSMITFTLYGVRYLMKKKVEGAAALFRRLIDWLKRKDNRFPQVQEIGGGITPEQARENVKSLRELIAGLT
ncbi:MAG: hypothetical protein WC489_09075 [Patescibacteria group bacterium]|jgi:hypothetical protein|nr:hypothetical protein [Candidatus Neomarinimicrobiota bacterium]